MTKTLAFTFRNRQFDIRETDDNGTRSFNIMENGQFVWGISVAHELLVDAKVVGSNAFYKLNAESVENHLKQMVDDGLIKFPE